MGTHQNGTDSNDPATRQTVAVSMGIIMRFDIAGTGSSGPMHTGNCKGQDSAAESSARPGVGPTIPPPEKDSESNRRGEDCNGSRPNDMANPIKAVVVGNSKLSDIVHATNRGTRQKAGEEDAGITGLCFKIDGIERG